MKFVLDKRYRLRGWYKLPYGVYDTQKYEARFFDRHAYDLIMRCDAAHDIDVTALDEPKSAFLQDMLDNQPPHPRRHQSRLPHRSPLPTDMTWDASCPIMARLGRRRTTPGAIRATTASGRITSSWSRIKRPLLQHKREGNND